VKNVIEAADELTYAFHLRTGLPRVQLARRIRFGLLDLLPPKCLLNLYTHVKMRPAPAPHMKMRPLSPRDRAALHERLQSASLGDDLHLCATMCLVGGLNPYTKALADAIRVTVAIERAPQTDELIAQMHAALLRCQVAAASHTPRARGGKKTAERRKTKLAAGWHKTAGKLRGDGLNDVQIGLRLGKHPSTVGRALNGKIARS